VLGTEALEKYLDKYNLKLEAVFDELLGTPPACTQRLKNVSGV
jgi:hypothetical protein